MAWTGVITNAGSQMLSACTVGATCNIVRAAAGMGTVNEAALLTQTNLVELKQEMSVLALTKVDNGYKVKLQLTAPAVGYSLNQIGIWASLDDGEYTMLAIFQRGDSVPIPSSGESPDFVYSFYGVLAVSSDGNMTISVDTSAIITASTLQEAVASAVAAHNADLTAHSNQQCVFAISIPTSAWTLDEAAADKYIYYADIASEQVVLEHCPDVALDKGCLEAACVCGLCPVADIPSAGVVRFYSQAVPTAEISGTCTLWLRGAGGTGTGTGTGGGGTYALPVASATTLGAVKIGEGINVSADGTITPDVLSEDEIKKIID